MPVKVIVAEGTRADCKEACALIDGLSAGVLLADYDTENILRKAGEYSCLVGIPPKKSRKILRNHGRELYKVRSRVKDAFLLSSAGGELLHGMSKDAPLFLPPLKSDEYLCGQI